LKINKEIKMKKLSKRSGFLLLVLALLFSVSACGDDKTEETKSMEQLQAENGVPVVLKEVQPESFTKYVSFYGTASGKRQTTVGAMTGGRIEKVLIKAGDFVKKDQVVIEFPDDLPSSQIEQAKAAYENSEKTFNRMKKLLEAGETSQSNFDNVQTQYLVNKRNYEALQQILYVQAPYDGTVTGVMVNPGDGVKAEAPLFTIANLSTMKVKVWVSDKENAQIRKGANAIISYNGKEYSGKVSEKDISMDMMHLAFGVEVEFANTDKLPSGITVDVKIEVYKNSSTIVIARNLLKKDKTGNYVYLVKGENATKTYVKTGEDYSIYYEVTSGLKFGDKLITKGNERVEDGSKIKVIQ